MPHTVDAAELAKMNERGEIKGCIVDGPFGFDNAISEVAAARKGITSPMAGKADLVIFADIDVGNVFYKALVLHDRGRPDGRRSPRFEGSDRHGVPGGRTGHEDATRSVVGTVIAHASASRSRQSWRARGGRDLPREWRNW